MRHFLSGLREGIAEDWRILLGAGTIWALLLLLLASKGVDGLQVESYALNLVLYLLCLLPLGMFVVGRMLYRERPVSPIRFLIALFLDGGWARSLGRGAPVLASLVVFMPAFSAIKSAIPLFNPFGWDGMWIAADQAIFGTDAWRFFQPLLGFPIVTSALSVAYVLWFFLIYSGSVYFCFLARDRELRARYFITYFAVWTACGVFLAILLSSVGPCFVGPLRGDQRLDEQIANLRAPNEQYTVLVLKAEDFLLAAQTNADHGLGAGISAMPSMHVAMALLVAMAVSKTSRVAAVAGFAFFATIQIASIHLGPHYAADGLVAIAVTVAIWALARPLARRASQAAARTPKPRFETPGPIATA
jgi:hypothetical protein